MAASIIREYQRRGARGSAVAEWYSIDPPYPAGIFGDEKLIPGTYCNGGIMPLVGGELARAAFEHGFEEYGVRQLIRYEELTRANRTFLWYFPDGRESTIETSTSPDASPTDGWGSSAMLYGLMEGLAGVVDEASLFRKTRLSPRWVAAGCDDAHVCASYGASGAYVQYHFAHRRASNSIETEIEGNGEVHLHLLLPKGTRPIHVSVNGRQVRHRQVRVEMSAYVDTTLRVRKNAAVQVTYAFNRKDAQ
jgi:hypothetical protein